MLLILIHFITKDLFIFQNIIIISLDLKLSNFYWESLVNVWVNFKQNNTLDNISKKTKKTIVLNERYIL